MSINITAADDVTDEPGAVARRNPDLQPAMAAARQDHELNQTLQESVRDGLSGKKAAKFNSHTQALSARLQGDARTIMEQQGHVRKKIAELQEELDDLDNAHKSLMAAVMSMQGWQK